MGMRHVITPFMATDAGGGAQARRRPRRGPGRRSSASSAGGRPDRQGDLPPGRLRAPRHDPQDARHPGREGLLDLRVPGQHRHRLAAADRRPGRGARVPPARRPRRLPRHRQRPELPDAGARSGEPRAYPFASHFLDRAAGIRLHYLDEGTASRSSCSTATRPGRSTTATSSPPSATATAASCPTTSAAACPTSRRRRATTTRSRAASTTWKRCSTTSGVRENVTLVLHDWGGMIGMAYAARHPERVKRLVDPEHRPRSTCRSRSRFPWSLWLGRNTRLGAWLIRGRNAFCPAAANVVRDAQAAAAGRARGVPAPYDSWANRIAVLRFVQTIPLTADRPGLRHRHRDRSRRCRSSPTCRR